MIKPARVLSAPAAIAASLNHLLAQENWARLRLQEHAGKIASMCTELVTLTLKVTPDGLLEAAAPAMSGSANLADVPDADTKEQPANVTIRVKLADLPLILQNRERAFSYVKLEGDADFANVISQLGQSLRWEAEHDLQPLVGEIAATRMVAGAKAALHTMKAGRQRLAENLAEYFLEENPMLMRPQAIAAFGADVAKARDDVERLAKRIEKLAKKITAKTQAELDPR
jgi:ubiquinone biosynthesis protein UbiJ